MDIANPERLRDEIVPTRKLREAIESTNIMKRDWDQYTLGADSSDEKDDTEEDQDYAPGRAAKKRKESGGRRAEPAPKKRGHASKTAKSSTAAAPLSLAAGTATTAAAASASKASEGANSKLAISINARLPECNIGAVEVLTFFPDHMRWPELGLRLLRNGWKPVALAKGVLHARNELSRNNSGLLTKRDNTLKKLKKRVGVAFFDDAKFTWKSYARAHRLTPVTAYDATNYAPGKQQVTHPFTAKLVKIAKGVKHWPKGEDRGIVTQAIEFAVRNRRSDLTTADIPQLARTHGFQDPQDSHGNHWDQHALQRNEARIEITGNCPGPPKVKDAFQNDDEDENVAGDDGFENEVDDEDDLSEEDIEDEDIEDEEGGEDGFGAEDVEDEV